MSEDLKKIVNRGKEESGNSAAMEQKKEYVVAYAPIETAGYGLAFQTSKESILSAADKTKRAAVWIIVLSALFTFFIAWYIARRISRPIHTITDHVTKLAAGNLTSDTVKVKSNDEIGQLAKSVNTMSLNLKNLIEQVQYSSDIVAGSADELTATSEQTSVLTKKVTTALQHVSGGADQQSEGVRESVGALAEDTHQFSNRIKELIEQIQKDVSISVKGMDQVTEEVRAGLNIADDAHASFNEIIQSAKLVSSQIDHMAATTQQISAGSQQMVSSFEEAAKISKVTSANMQEVAVSSKEQLASTENIASSAQLLSDQALDLRALSKKFTIE